MRNWKIIFYGSVILAVLILFSFSINYVGTISFDEGKNQESSSSIIEDINLSDLVEIEYMGINGNDELLQMAEDNNWTGTGYEWDPIIIEGYYFRGLVHHFVVDNTDLYWEFRNNVLDGIDDRYCEIVLGNLRNGRISNNYFMHGAVGVHGIRINDCVISGNEFFNQSWDGVLLEYCNNNIIIGNTFVDEGEGGVLGWIDSEHNNILYNEVYGSPYGFMFWDGSDENTVQHNSIHDITIRGIDIQTANNVIRNNEIYNLGGDGIAVSQPGTVINDNLLHHGVGYGIQLYSLSGDALIEHNVIIGFDAGGINLHESDNSYIEHNDFYENTQHQAWDYGESNIFTDNYWHEWISNDTNENGILDEPKEIAGGDNVDPRPRAFPVNSIPAWYEFIPITGPPPEPEPTETTSTSIPITETSSTSETTASITTILTETNYTNTINSTMDIVFISIAGISSVLVVIFLVRRRN